jgi:hypothetical protein
MRRRREIERLYKAQAWCGAGNMPRVNWLLLILALSGVGGGVALWGARAAGAAHLM